MGAFAWHKRAQPEPTEPSARTMPMTSPTETTQLPAERPAERAVPVAFHCDGRVYCRQMNSCEEAVYFLRNCPGVKMDGDGDGRPCEDRCGHW